PLNHHFREKQNKGKSMLNLKHFSVLFLLFNVIFIAAYSSLLAQPDTLKPDYRNHKNIPEYDPSLMPLNYNNKTSTGVWTELNPKVPRVDYIGIDFVDSLTGWAVGANGAIIKTKDGGNNWEVITSPVTNTLLKVNSYDGATVLITGFDGIILRSTDGGDNFTQIITGLPAGSDLWSVQMINDTLGWVCGMQSTLLKTTNGGVNWQSVNSGFNSHYWWLEFVDDNIGYIACDGGKILKTTNGGNDWTQAQAGDARALYSLDAIDTLHIIAAGASGKNAYSSDGGNTWIQNSDLIYSAVNCVAFVNADTGYAIGEDWGIRKTTDMGANWFASNVNIGEWHIKLLKERAGYIVGSGLKIYRTANGYDNWKRLINNDYFYGIHFITEMKGFTLSGRLYLTTDGGESWKETNGPAGYVLTFTDSLNGYIGTSYTTPYGHSVFTIYRSTDGGMNWFNTVITGEIDSSARIQKIFFINNNTGWAVTTRGGIIKTTDGGSNWFVQLNTYNYIIFSGIHFTDTLNGWTANANNRPMKTVNGGNTWITQQQINLSQTNDVFFTNVLNGWLIESFGLYQTTNGGLNWTKIPGVSDILRSFKLFKEEKHWFIIGGTRYETTDGGATWINITNSSPPMNSFHSPSNGIGYACGEMGLLVKYIDSAFVPVELSNFIAEMMEDKIILKWRTITETNNFGFEIEKKNAAGEWNFIGSVQGKGTTTNTHEYEFSDKTPFNGTNIYRLKQLDYDGREKFYLSNEVYFSFNMEYELYQNYPNPFNPATKIKYSLPFNSKIKLYIINILGEEIEILKNTEHERGLHEITWINNNCPSGLYLLILDAKSLENEQSFRGVRKLLLIK
ncbi:MAG: hypothetical protein K8H86_11950, partial [Ignavibacteriaceae bacterium]|nr:hypothetical protein [Ignavibacteriaceae bacterium]